jgi:hypothetical protein
MQKQKAIASGSKVFLLQHTYEKECGCVAFKVIGIFSTKALAQKSLKSLSTQPGFSEHPKGFYIGEYIIERRHWDGGFFTYEYETEVPDEVTSPRIW